LETIVEEREGKEDSSDEEGEEGQEIDGGDSEERMYIVMYQTALEMVLDALRSETR
jgi:hypothetical protein